MCLQRDFLLASLLQCIVLFVNLNCKLWILISEELSAGWLNKLGLGLRVQVPVFIQHEVNYQDHQWSSSSPPVVDLQDHQRVILTCWCIVLVLPAPRQLPSPPTSRINSLVCHTCSPLPLVDYQDRQWVILTRWCLVLVLPTPRRPVRPPTSQYDSLVRCPCPPRPSSTTKSTNESLWLIGALSSSSPPLVNYQNHQRVVVTRWYVVLPVPRRPSRPPTSRIDSLVYYINSTSR